MDNETINKAEKAANEQLAGMEAQERLVPELLDGISEVRKCSFKPEEHFIRIKFRDTGIESFYLEAKWRVFWFHVYCEEHGIKHYAIEEGDIQLIGKYIVANALVRMDGEIAGRAAGGCYIGNEGVEFAIQQAATVAKGRALANAGFGTVFSSASISENGAAEIPADGGINVRDTAADFIRQNPMAGLAMAGIQSAREASAATAEKSANDTEMTRDEALRYVVPTGRYAGQAMGDVFGKNPSTIRYYAENARFDGQAIQKVAKIILNKT